MRERLAAMGGSPVRSARFADRKTMGPAEKEAALRVLDSGVLSAFIGGAGKFFEGGDEVRAMEAEWAQYFGYRHAISVNSWTSGLVAAVGAAGVGPGDEVITSPYTMSASATAALAYGAVPVFADVEDRTFGLDPASVRARITPRTRAIIVVHLFGHPARMDELTAIADEHDLVLIEDAAQAPGAEYQGRKVGALSDIGGFSLNYHKHIHAGEGGVLVTDDDELATRCKLIRNHGEAVVERAGISRLDNTVGWNFRLTELQAGIARAQLERLDGLLAHRERLAMHLTRRLEDVPGITPPVVEPGCRHSYYLYPMRYDAEQIGLPRSLFTRAVNAELPTPQNFEATPLTEGYTRPLYLQPLYQERIGMGQNGFPFRNHEGELDYSRGSCPTAERLYNEEMILSPLVREPLTERDMDDLIGAVTKVLGRSDELREWAEREGVETGPLTPELSASPDVDD